VILSRLTCRGFRNLEETEVGLAPGMTVLLGDNGQGKTSFLEAIGVLATTRSFRRARAAELVRHGESAFSLSGRVEAAAGTLELALAHEDGRRRTWLGRAPVELAEYVGQLTVVAITQAHAGIVRGSPQDRRDFLDRGILGLTPAYLRALSSHRRALRQKNALLRGEARAAELEAWNARLAAEAAELVVRRREYVASLSAVLEELGPLFLPSAEPLALELQDACTKDEALAEGLAGGEPSARAAVAELLERRMSEAAQRERSAGQALVGPHRDDLTLSSGGRDLRRFASSGQQRNALLALKVAKVELFRRRRGEPPVLLVDDIDTEIDPRRLETFLRHAAGRAQTVVTSSKRGLFSEPSEGALHLHVEGGRIRPE
jgi:DNA replication and repair protein RecF